MGEVKQCVLWRDLNKSEFKFPVIGHSKVARFGGDAAR
jgi:hypothetical protein